MKRIPYILQGPHGMGNQFAAYHAALLPAGRWAIVTHGPYANGGQGPISADGKMYRSLEDAQAALAEMRGVPR